LAEFAPFAQQLFVFFLVLCLQRTVGAFSRSKGLGDVSNNEKRDITNKKNKNNKDFLLHKFCASL